MSRPTKYLSEDTKTFTWISSGQTASPMLLSIFDGSETVVSSVSMTDSGNGHYYKAQTLPVTPGFYVVEWKATISSNPYKKRERIQIVNGTVD